MLLSISGWSPMIPGLLLPVLLAQDPAVPTTQVDLNPAQLFGGLIGYLIVSFFVMKILDKCNAENSWFAFIPILNTYAILQAGDDDNPLLWTLLGLIPCINIVTIIKLIIAWINICKKIGQSPWLLLLFLIPCVNIILLGYFAFG